MNNRSITVQLDSGETVCLRPVRPDDKPLLRAGIAALSDHSRYLRFFTGARTMPDDVIERLCNADGSNHIAWGAIDLSAPGHPAIGVVHAIRRGASNEADLALAVLDDWHGKGLARLLLTAVISDARTAGISALTADTLAENRAARRLFRYLGGLSAHREGPVVSYRFDIETAARKLAAMTTGPAAETARAALESGIAPRRWARPA